MKKKTIILLAIFSFILGACASNSVFADALSTESQSGLMEPAVSTSVDALTADLDDDDLQIAVADAQTTTITFNGDVITVNGNGAVVQGNAVTINTAGTYLLSGILDDGQVMVNVGDEETVSLIFSNVNITSLDSAPVYVLNAEKVIITLADGTNNTINDSASRTDLDEDGDPDAAIFSHDDLTINGSGSLTVQANYSEGIESRDDLKITGGNLSITAVAIGLFGNNSFEMQNAGVTISAGGDTIHSDGDIIIESGTMMLISGDDGMHADGILTINGGVIDIQQCFEGLEATDVIINGGTIDIIATDDGINGAGGNDNSGLANGSQQDNFGGSQCSIVINGGTITIEAALSGAGDGLDANGTITITGGDMVIKVPLSYRDYSSIDSNTGASLTGGNVQILNADGTYTQVTASNIGDFGMRGGGGGGKGGGGR